MAGHFGRVYVVLAFLVSVHACLRFDKLISPDVAIPSVRLGVAGTQYTGVDANATSVYGFVDVNTDAVLKTVSDKFLSVAIDAFMIRPHWAKLNFSSPRLLTLARGLLPSYLRVSGTAADFLYFNETVPPTQPINYEDGGKFTMTVDDWDAINEFSNKVGWSMIFGLNVLIRKDSKWDPTNAIQLFDYTIAKGYHVDWELGNEPNLFPNKANITIEPSKLADDVINLRNYLNSRAELKSCQVFGPDVTRPQAHTSVTSSLDSDALEYLTGFVKSVGDAVNSTTFHQYYLCSEPPTKESFTDVDNLNVFVKQVQIVQEVVTKYQPPGAAIWLGETGTTCSLGASTLSQTYVAGFMWMDKLGIAATYGLQVVVRQTFVSGNQGLLDDDFTPRPDYWLSVLYKRLVGRRVLSVKVTTQNDNGDTLRAYAHCTNNNMKTYPSGSITVYMLSVNRNESTTVFITGGLLSLEVDQYLLTSHGEEGVTSRRVDLNGKELKLVNDHTFPDLSPQTIVAGSPIIVPPLSLGFYVVPDAHAKACM